MIWQQFSSVLQASQPLPLDPSALPIPDAPSLAPMLHTHNMSFESAIPADSDIIAPTCPVSSPSRPCEAVQEASTSLPIAEPLGKGPAGSLKITGAPDTAPAEATGTFSRKTSIITCESGGLLGTVGIFSRPTQTEATDCGRAPAAEVSVVTTHQASSPMKSHAAVQNNQAGSAVNDFIIGFVNTIIVRFTEQASELSCHAQLAILAMAVL
jgi:hypothetical protein